MYAVLLLSAMIAGQCSGGFCPAPSFSQPSFVPSFPVYTPAAARPLILDPVSIPAQHVQVFKIGRHRVNYKGLAFEVEGYVNERGNINWNPDEEFNRLSHAAALARSKAVPPTPAKAAPAAPKAVGFNADPFPGGVAHDLVGRRRAITAHGDAAKQFVAEATAPAEATRKLHVTVIGSDDARAPVVNDLLTNPALAPFRDRLLIQGYKPGEWPVDTTLGFVADGKPSIVIQNSRGIGDLKGGRVLWRAMDYSMGPAGLAEAIRKADPNYKPGNDPGPASPVLPSLPTDASTGLIAALAVVVGVILFLPRKEG